jgi:hypothetical protein
MKKNYPQERSDRFTKIYYVACKNFDVFELNVIIFFNHEIRFSELSELSNYFSFQRFYRTILLSLVFYYKWIVLTQCK